MKKRFIVSAAILMVIAILGISTVFATDNEPITMDYAPIVDGEIEKYGTNTAKFLSVKPGLTGYWAANGRNNITYSERIKMELYYVDNMSFGLDLKIFLKTIVSVIKKEGAN